MPDMENQAVEAQEAPAPAVTAATAATTATAATATIANSAISSNVPLPPHFNTSGDLAAQWKKYKQLWDSFEIVTGLKERDSGYRTATFITCIGPEALEIFNGLPFDSEDDKKNIEKVLELFQSYCVGETNVTYERYLFNARVQESGEAFESFVSSLRQLSLSCNFGAMREEMIKDRIVIGVADTQLRRSLLQEPKLTLKSAIERGRAMETTKQQLKMMTSTAEVSSIRKTKRSVSKQQRYQASDNSSCKYCGRRHARNKTKCPAYGKTCGFCSKRNHFEAMCMVKKHRGKG